VIDPGTIGQSEARLTRQRVLPPRGPARCPFGEKSLEILEALHPMLTVQQFDHVVPDDDLRTDVRGRALELRKRMAEVAR
jgi:hypothetical protein